MMIDPKKPLTRFYSFRNGLRLMVANGYEYRMICPKGEVRDSPAIGARLMNGDTDLDEIPLKQAEALALKVSGLTLEQLKIAVNAI